MRKMNRRPTTPGEILKHEFLEPLSITQRQLADQVGMEVKAINRLVNGHSSVSKELACALSCAFDTSTAFWVNLQAAVDAYDAEQLKKDKKIDPIIPTSSAAPHPIATK